jgi:hypothetical protein
MDLKNFKLGVGPMSREIISILDSYDKNLMVVASRNQVDFNSGYVCTIDNLKISNPKIIICRDHCGPYFADKDNNLTLEQAILQCKKTILNDIKNNISIIHIDVSKIPKNLQFYYAQDLIEFAIENNPNIKLEFGSEENTGEGIEDSFKRLNLQLEFASKFNKHIVYFVTQTGSLVKDSQIGNFNYQHNQKIIDTVHSAGFLFKEHNADYLKIEDLKIRKQIKIDAVNIAPQLGVIQTNILNKLSKNSNLFMKFRIKVLESKKFEKWLDSNKNNTDDVAFNVSAHYFFNTFEYNELINDIDYSLYKSMLKLEIQELLDLYITQI